MSELFFCYLANSILRGAVVVGLLWLIELCCRRRFIFAGGRWLYLAALLLILLPFEQLAALRASTPLPVRPVELPVWSVALPPPEPEEAAPAAEVSDVQTAPSGTAAAVSVSPEPSRSVVETKERPGFSGRISNCLFLLYLAGALLLSAKQLRRFFQWRNRVRRCIAITGGRVYDVFLESKRFAKLEHRPVALRDCGGLLPAGSTRPELRSDGPLYIANWKTPGNIPAAAVWNIAGEQTVKLKIRNGRLSAVRDHLGREVKLSPENSVLTFSASPGIL